jgi:hypothetical protein
VRTLSVVLDFLSLHNVKGVAGMSAIKLQLPLQLRCRELAEQRRCRQSAQR